MKSAAELLDHRNIMIAVKKGLVRREEFREALWEQRRLQAQTRSYKPIGDILIDRGILTESQRQSILPPLLCRSMGWSSNPDPIAGQHPQAMPADSAPCADGAETSAPAQESGLSAQHRIQAQLFLRVDEDGLAAFIQPAGQDYRDVSLQDVKNLLEKEGIVFGCIDDDSILKRLSQQPEDSSPLQVAAGTPPEPGLPDEVNYHFDTNPFRVGTITENGIMDWKDRGEMPQVAAGDLLAEIIPGKKAKPGRNVFGKILPPEQAKRVRLRPGKGVDASEDRLKFFAKVSGQPQVTGQGNLSVLQTIMIPGDVGIETGHVVFDGHIEVKGAVQRGYRVKGGSLKAREILSQDVDIAGDVVALKGIFGAKIRAGGRLKANHINKSSIVATDDVVVAKEIVDCSIITNGKCILDGGTIISSEVAAKMGIRAGTVGSPASPPCTLVVGVDQIVQMQVAEYKQQITDSQKAINDFNRQIQELHLTSDRLNTQLGEIAQVQDRYMVEKRGIAESIEAACRQATDEERQTMEQLQAEITAIDGQVAQMMAEDEKAQASILALRNDILTREQTIQELKIKIEEAIAQSKQRAGIPSLQVAGKLFPRTHIKGPNDAQVVDEIVEHVNIKEQKNTDPALGKSHVLKIAPR